MRLLLSATALLLITACQTQMSSTQTNPNVRPASVATATMKRPNLVVADIDRSIALYEALLGFQSQPIEVSTAESFSYPVFKIPRDANIRFIVMNDMQDERAFALTEVKGMRLPPLPKQPHMSAYVIGVTDLRAKIERVKAQGLWTSPAKIVEGTDFTFIEQAFTDYDGHLIVLYEVLS